MENVLIILAASALYSASSLRTHLYHFVSEPKNWTEAQSYCRETHTDLAAIETMEDMDILNGMADLNKMGDSNVSWIGLFNDVNSWRWSMSNGESEETEFRNWAPGEPNNAGGKDQCGRMRDSGLWYDAPCDGSFTSVCSDVRNMTETFIHIDINMTWTEAQCYCREEHMDLARVRNIRENQQIQELIPAGETVWIGIFRDSWKWSDSRVSTFEYWQEGQPAGGLENCVAVDFVDFGKWAGWTCDVRRAFICYSDVQIRLSGPSRCSGRVEILHEGSWGTVCDDGWDLNDASVVCRQLDCGAAMIAAVSAHFGQGTGPIWLDDVNCTGSESNLSECLHNGFGIQNCGHAEDAGVVCLDVQVRLSGPSRCSGRVEIFYEGSWGTVCDDGWDLNDASVVCRQLSCGPAETSFPSAYFGEGTGPIWLDNVVCSGRESSLSACPHNGLGRHNCVHGEDAGVTCSDLQIRLSGPSRCSGRVEIFYEGSWGTVCDDGWDLNDASVVCRQLDCGTAMSAPPSAHFGQGTGPIWLDNVVCSGSESSLSVCPHNGFGKHNCGHDEDAGVVCSGLPFTKQVVKVRLTRTSSLDLNDPTVLEDMLNQLKEKLRDQEVSGDIKLSWMKQPDGEVFHNEKMETKKIISEQDEL